MPEIHPTASIDPSAQLSDDVRIGPYCVIGPGVYVGEGTLLDSHVVIERDTWIGSGNRIFPFACLGTAPQDLKYRGEATRLEIGNGNIIREYVTLNRGTIQGPGVTRIGNSSIFMANSHVAHDCVVGDQVVFANSAAIAGHVQVGDRVVLGGMAGVHQFARIGALAFVAAGAMASQDVPPFACVHGDRARLVGLNLVGIQRAGLDAEVVRSLKSAYWLLFRSGLTRVQALGRIHQELEPNPALTRLLDFVVSSTRGICRYRRPVS